MTPADRWLLLLGALALLILAALLCLPSIAR